MAVVEANKTDYVECSPESFGDTDPQPGVEKECYCDDRKKVEKTTVTYWIYYWQQKREEQEAREAQAKADADAEAARLQAKENQEK